MDILFFMFSSIKKYHKIIKIFILKNTEITFLKNKTSDTHIIENKRFPMKNFAILNAQE